MTLYKKGTESGEVKVSSTVYSCTKCDFTEMASSKTASNRKCPVCDADMTIISASAETEEQDEE